MTTRRRQALDRAPVSASVPRSALDAYREAIRLTIKDRPDGSPIGLIRQPLTDAGLNDEQFDYLIGSLAEQGWITRQGDVLYPGRNYERTPRR